MSITNPAKHLPRASRWPRGPEFAFAGTLLIAFAGMVASTKMLPSDLVLPVVRALNEPHHLLGIDLRGDADSE